MNLAQKRSLAKQELYQAIAYFIERQQLVVHAMLDLKLDLDAMGKFGASGWVSRVSSIDGKSHLDTFSQEPINERQREFFNAVKYAEEMKVPGLGSWRDKSGFEWKYLLHGAGCSLINVQTNEPIDWDCPNPKAFDKFFLYRHLEWRVNARQDENDLKWMKELLGEFDSLRLLVNSLFADLLQDGLIQECPMPMGLVYVLKEYS
jgi:hypothetical protein